MTRFAVVDMQTNGLLPGRGGRVFEVAVVLVEDGQVRGHWHSLLNPGLGLPPFVTALTGVTASMVRAAPTAAQGWRECLSTIGDATVVVHNSSLLRPLWDQELAEAGLADERPMLCTLRLARRLYPRATRHKPAALAPLLGVPLPPSPPRARHFALLQARVFLHMLQDLTLLYPQTRIDAGFLMRYQRSSRSVARAADTRVAAYD